MNVADRFDCARMAAFPRAEVTVAEDNPQPESRKFAETMSASFVAAPSADELSAERTGDGRADNAGADHRHGIIACHPKIVYVSGG